MTLEGQELIDLLNERIGVLVSILNRASTPSDVQVLAGLVDDLMETRAQEAHRLADDVQYALKAAETRKMLEALPEYPPEPIDVAPYLGLAQIKREGEYGWVDDRGASWWTETIDGVRYRRTYAWKAA